MSGSPGASSGKQLQLKGDIPKASVGAIFVFHAGDRLASFIKYLATDPAKTLVVKAATLAHFDNAVAASNNHLRTTNSFVQDCFRMYTTQSAEVLTIICARLSKCAHGTVDGTCWYTGCDDEARILAHFDKTLGTIGESGHKKFDEDCW